jgi:hypothetical protein
LFQVQTEGTLFKSMHIEKYFKTSVNWDN